MGRKIIEFTSVCAIPLFLNSENFEDNDDGDDDEGNNFSFRTLSVPQQNL